MSITADFHMHSSHSGDGNTPMEEMIRQALNTGLTHLCFTEHQDFDYPASPDLPPDYFLLDTDAYRQELISVQEQYKDQIQVGFGVELGLQPHLTAKLQQYVKSWPFDFIIASSHVCNGQDPYYPAFYKGRPRQDAYREYFASILETIRTFQDFDVYGHLDYIVRYGPDKDQNYTYEPYADILDEILRLLIQPGKGLEINTGGLRCGLRETNPCLSILKRYRRLGGEIITAGSDAHTPEDIGYAFRQAEELLKAAGFSHYTTFHNRRPLFHRL